MKTILIATACLSLGACATDQVTMSVGTGLLVSERAADGLNTMATTAAQSGICKGSCASKAKTGIDTVNQGVTTAKGLYNAGKTALAAAQLTQTTKDVADTSKTIGGQP